MSIPDFTTKCNPYDQAAGYVEHGWSIVPVLPGKKRALVKWEQFLSRRPTPTEIALWRQRYPDANIGIITGPVSGLVVLDYDGPQALAATQGYELPDTPTVRSGRASGRHVYFAHPGGPLQNYTGKNALLPGLDFIANGYIVAPPSLHKTGRRYQWEVPPTVPLAPLPAWVADLITAKQAPAAMQKAAPAAPAMGAGGDLAARQAFVEQALGVSEYRNGKAAVLCPFHDDHTPSATWYESGFLKCHAGCRPGVAHVSNGHDMFGLVDTSNALGFAGRPEQHFNIAAHPHTAHPHTLETPPPAKVKTFAPNGAAFFPSPHSGNLDSRESHFAPLNCSISLGGQNETRKRGKVYRLKSEADMLGELGLAAHEVHYMAVTAQELASSKLYRAAVYSDLPTRLPGHYKRSTVARAGGVSEWSARRYDKLAAIVVKPDIKPEELKNSSTLPAGRRGVPGNVWLEDTSGRKRAPTKQGFDLALAGSMAHNGETTVYRMTRRQNYYEGTRPRDNAPQGLPVEVRRALIANGKTIMARVADALMLSGMRPGEPFTAQEAIKKCAPYGIGRSTVYKVLKTARVGLKTPQAARYAVRNVIPLPNIPKAPPDGHSVPFCAACGQSNDHDQLAQGEATYAAKDKKHSNSGRIASTRPRRWPGPLRNAAR